MEAICEKMNEGTGEGSVILTGKKIMTGGSGENSVDGRRKGRAN